MLTANCQRAAFAPLAAHNSNADPEQSFAAGRNTYVSGNARYPCPDDPLHHAA